jgi:hypothetical protein
MAKPNEEISPCLRLCLKRLKRNFLLVAEGPRKPRVRSGEWEDISTDFRFSQIKRTAIGAGSLFAHPPDDPLKILESVKSRLGVKALISDPLQSFRSSPQASGKRDEGAFGWARKSGDPADGVGLRRCVSHVTVKLLEPCKGDSVSP